MTPFEQAEESIKTFARRLIMFNLVVSTIRETEGMTAEESDLIWLTIFTLLETQGMMGDAN